jgi:hypothetical protein
MYVFGSLTAVIMADTPVRLFVSVAVMFVDSPTTLEVVKVIVARPKLLVVDVDGAAIVPLEPAVSLCDHVTTKLGVATGLPKESASWANICSVVPTCREYDSAVTRYCVAGPVRDVIVAEVPDKLFVSVAVMFVISPAVVDAVKVIVAIPELLVVDVVGNAKVPLVLAVSLCDHVTTKLGVATGLPNASASWAEI